MVKKLCYRRSEAFFSCECRSSIIHLALYLSCTISTHSSDAKSWYLGSLRIHGNCLQGRLEVLLGCKISHTVSGVLKFLVDFDAFHGRKIICDMVALWNEKDHEQDGDDSKRCQRRKGINGLLQNQKTKQSNLSNQHTCHQHVDKAYPEFTTGIRRWLLVVNKMKSVPRLR